MSEDRSFQPLHDRVAGLPKDETLYDGVPDWLDQPLVDWLRSLFWNEGREGSERLARRVLTRLRLAKVHTQQTYVDRAASASGRDLLTIVDAVLQLHPAWELYDIAVSGFGSQVGTLDEILPDAGSMYRIDTHGRCLVRRVDVSVQAAVDMAIATTTSNAADYLRAAWVAAYGVHPDPDKAYDNAILAIEELTCPLVCPRNPKATLGVVIADLRNHAAQWELGIVDTSTGQPASIASVIGILELLWKGQSRHAGGPNSRQQTPSEGEAAVHMAATLTQWLTAGILHRKP